MEHLDPRPDSESIGNKLAKAFGGMTTGLFGAPRRAALSGPHAVITNNLPAHRLFAGPTEFSPRGLADYGDRRGRLMNARTPVLVGVVIIVATFFGVGGWAVLAPIDSAALAPGQVTVESGRQTIQHYEGGIIKDILVKDGDHVKAGQVLLSLDGTRAHADLDLVQGQLDLAEANYARLVAERDGLPAPQYPASLTSRAADPKVAQAMADQTNLFKARLSVLNGQKSILGQQIAQYKQQINGFHAIELSKEGQLILIKTELTDLQGLLEQGFVTKSRVLALQRQGGELEGERGQAIAEMARAQQGIGEGDRQILELQNQRQEEVSKDIHVLEGNLSDLRQKQVASEDVVRRLDVMSPMDGTVSDLTVHTVGGVITPGLALMEIVPANDHLIVEAEISPMDIDTVHVGQEVSLRVMAAGSRLLPAIDGRVEEISADRLVTPGTPGTAPRSYYQARISVSPDQAERLGDVPLKVGMPVEAMITRGSQTAMHYALKPLIDSFSKSFREQ